MDMNNDRLTSLPRVLLCESTAGVSAMHWSPHYDAQLLLAGFSDGIPQRRPHSTSDVPHHVLHRQIGGVALWDISSVAASTTPPLVEPVFMSRESFITSINRSIATLMYMYVTMLL
jgi:hypothetical protein